MFYITVSNGLLTQEHKERMGIAVWEFMWCIDKITRIDDDGKGWVLGGKPIKLRDIGMSSNNRTSLHLDQLREHGYIETIRTPYGMIIKIINAKKRFTASSDSPLPVIHRKRHRDPPLSMNPDPPLSMITKKTVLKETVQIPIANAKNNKKSMKTYKESDHSDDGLPSMNYETREVEETSDVSKNKNTPEMKLVYEVFSDNPAYVGFGLIPAQRTSTKNLLNLMTLEDIKHNYFLVKKYRSEKYCPQINSPYEMLNKMVAMQTFLKNI